MREAIEFSTKHNIKPHLTLFKLEELPKMVEIMVFEVLPTKLDRFN
jgi:hypothetical protein